VVEALTHQSLEMYVNEQFYKPLGLQHTCFNPVLKGVPASAIPPTVMDWKFRYQLVQGFVNDECAALLGGVAGHAGLFGSAWDVARILEMICRGGAYGGRQYFKPETVALFTAYAGVGRRGLGWDKPDRQHPEEGPCAPQASEATFGHLGFTGTCAWADPERELVYVLLSNRTYPDADNVSFVREAIRKRAMEIVYQGLPQ
jgi:CubicO group peptidase (beta-lactamase class C family)